MVSPSVSPGTESSVATSGAHVTHVGSKQLLELLQNVPAVVWEAYGAPDESQQRIDFVSDYVEQMLGYSVEQWLSVPNFWLTIVHPDDRERAAQEGLSIFQSGRRGVSRFRWMTADGRAIWVEAQSTVILDAHGAPIGMRGVTMDITEQKNIEDSLAESEALFRYVTGAAPVMLWLADATGERTFFNRQWEEFTGIDEAMSKGYGWLNAVHPEDQQKYLDVYVDSVKRQQSFRLDYRLKHRTGGYRWVLGAGSPRYSASGEYAGLVGTSIDITSRKDAEHALIIARDLADEANRAKDKFIAMISHELRTPLTPVLTAIELLEMDAHHHPQFKPLLDLIRRNVEHEARLIDDLLDLTRITRGSMTVNKVRLDIHDALRTVHLNCASAAVQKGVQLEVICEAEKPVIQADPNRLQQILLNLVNNALKFTSSGGRITLATTNGRRTLHVKVTDNGSGIAPDFLPYIFEAFRQGEHRTSDVQRGLGLGLAIAKQLALLHDGDLTAHSDGPGQGSCFTLTLPLSR